jgi:hypothetical protein
MQFDDSLTYTCVTQCGGVFARVIDDVKTMFWLVVVAFTLSQRKDSELHDINNNSTLMNRASAW